MVSLNVYLQEAMAQARAAMERAGAQAGRVVSRALGEMACETRAQGTTEYAILVGVLVVIAIIAIVAFRDRVSELWEAITSGINSL